MKTNNKVWLTPALKLVRKYAPHTYEAMINCADWTVHAVFSEKDLLPVARDLSPWATLNLVEGINDGLACTIGKTREFPSWVSVEGTALETLEKLNHTTWVNIRALMGQAHHGGVDPVHLAASVLVHEWMHRRGYGEREAYDEGTRFALKMGQPRIARMSEQTKARVVA